MPALRVLVCGDRNWDDKATIMKALKKLLEEHHGFKPPNLVVIDGVARGADSLGHICALDLNCETERYPADWEKHGKAAGPIRNQQMLNEGKPDLVLAFHSDLLKSKGTKNMVEIAMKAGVEVRVITGEKSDI